MYSTGSVRIECHELHAVQPRPFAPVIHKRNVSRSSRPSAHAPFDIKQPA
jgi:hypothetical protein